ncbi:MAG: DNA-processing protein DprA, partial [Kiritimatiellae bacterium]|nr:DNA-processing protein DprA [Kiritimatiellia bacterium]
MTEREAYVAFNLTEKVGFASGSKLVLECGSVVDAWEAFPRKISRSGKEIDYAREFALAEKFGVKIVTLADSDYPAQLRNAPGCPLVLYVKGSLEALSKPSVAMIGTCRATDYG